MREVRLAKEDLELGFELVVKLIEDEEDEDDVYDLDLD